MDYFKKSKEKIENNKYDICLVLDDASGLVNTLVKIH